MRGLWLAAIAFSSVSSALLGEGLASNKRGGEREQPVATYIYHEVDML